MQSNFETENFDQFINNLTKQNGGDWEEKVEDDDEDMEYSNLIGGWGLTKMKGKKLIFFNTADITNWGIFVKRTPPPEVTIKGLEDFKSQIKYANLFFTKESFYYQIHQKGYSCKTDDNQVHLIEVSSKVIAEKAKEFGQKVSTTATAVKTGTVAAASAVKTGTVAAATAVKTGVTSAARSVQSTAITAKDVSLENVAIGAFKGMSPSAQKLLIEKLKLKIGQAGGYMFDYEEISDKDIDDLFGGAQTFVPLGIKLDNIEKQYKDALAIINGKTGSKLNACLIVDESLAGKDKAEKLLLV